MGIKIILEKFSLPISAVSAKRMKLFLLAAAVSAQFDYDYGFSNYGLDEFALDTEAIGDYPDADGGDLARRERPRRPGRPQFGGRPTFGVAAPAAAPAAPAAPAAVEAADVNDERYFFTATTTTTTTVTVTVTTTKPREGDHCWKCDEMTFMECASKGEFTFCDQGEDNCCFVEVREKRAHLRQLCTGCKSTVACNNLRMENFVNTAMSAATPNGNAGEPTIDDQCRPDYKDQLRNMRDGSQQSVCRQCFRSCQPDHNSPDNYYYCFGAMVDNAAAGNVVPPNGVPTFLILPFANDPDDKWYGKYKERTEDARMRFGIPTNLALDCLKDVNSCELIENPTTTTAIEQTQNIYFGIDKIAPQAHSKLRTNAGDGNRAVTDMTYWGLEGAQRNWWVGDLKRIQDHFKKKTIDDVATAIQPADFDANTAINAAG